MPVNSTLGCVKNAINGEALKIAVQLCAAILRDPQMPLWQGDSSLAEVPRTPTKLYFKRVAGL